MSELKAIVVGSGVGGLVAAVLLAAQGLRVTVIERDAAIGGKVRAEEVDGRAVDAGPTVFTLREVFDEIFEAAGSSLDAHLRLVPAHTLARHAWTHGDEVACLDLLADPQAAAEAIGRFAGAADAAGYLAFCKRAAGVFQALDGPFMRRHRTNAAGLLWRGGWSGLPGLLRISPFAHLWPELARHFRDPRLQQLFGRYATYCGSSPWQAPATLMLVAHVERRGVWFVQGGMRRLVDALGALARRHGVEIRCGAEAREVTVRRGAAAGVVLQDGERLDADVVVFNGDAQALASGLLGHAATAGMGGLAHRWEQEGARSLSAMTWCGVARCSGFPLEHHNVFFSEDYAGEFDRLGQGELPRDPTVYVCAQDRSGDGAHPGSPDERLLCLVNAPAVADRRTLTAGEMARCEKATFNRLERCGLRLAGMAPMRRTTPMDFARRFPGTSGALYGAASHGWQAAFRRPGARHAMPGLYLAGGSTHPGPGLPMAALSGRLAASAVLADLRSTRPSVAMAMRGGMSTQ